jgi:hypothetical protein
VAATKTFNLAGAHVGACFTTNAALKRGIDARVMASGLGSYNSFGMIATEAAWRTGDAWLDALLPYLVKNRDLLDARIEAAAPGARSMRLASTYLAWVNFPAPACRPRRSPPGSRIAPRIFVSPGSQFGPGGETWQRFNFATPRPILEEALGRLDDAFRDYADRRALHMKRPVVGVIGNAHRIENRFNVQGVGERSLRAVAEVADALPLMFASAADITDLGRAAGGGRWRDADRARRANVHPSRFRTEPHAKHEPYDESRDALALALVEVCVARGIPLFGVCRGLQEMNVAYGRAPCIPRSASCRGASTIACRVCRPGRSTPTRRSCSPTGMM